MRTLDAGHDLYGGGGRQGSREGGRLGDRRGRGHREIRGGKHRESRRRDVAERLGGTGGRGKW